MKSAPVTMQINQTLADVNDVFRNISLFQIKKSYRNLLDMVPESLEGFVQKHSDYVIFLLNILDEKRSSNLLSRLTDAALIYLSEEELRNLLIIKVGQLASRGLDFNSVSVFMDYIDRPVSFKKGIKDRLFKEEKDIIGYITESRLQYANRYFKYLERIGIQRRENLCSQIMDRNIDVALGLLLYCPDMMLVTMADQFAARMPRILKFFPESLFLTRFEHGYSTYITVKIRKHLPVSIQKLLVKVIKFSQREEDNTLLLIQTFASGEMNEKQKKKARLDILAKMIRPGDLDYMELALFDLIKAGIIEAEDLKLIRSLQFDEL